MYGHFEVLVVTGWTAAYGTRVALNAVPTQARYEPPIRFDACELACRFITQGSSAIFSPTANLTLCVEIASISWLAARCSRWILQHLPDNLRCPSGASHCHLRD